MTDEEFEAELQRAVGMMNSRDERLYWCGYKRGLLRARQGRRFSSNTEHFAWLELRACDEPLLAELARGYADALQAVIDGKPRHFQAPGAAS